MVHVFVVTGEDYLFITFTNFKSQLNINQNLHSVIVTNVQYIDCMSCFLNS